MAQKNYAFLHSVIYAVATALGFAFALFLFAGIRTRLELADIPAPMRGVPIALISAGLLAMAFLGFSGM